MGLSGATGLHQLDASDDFVRARRRAFVAGAAGRLLGRRRTDRGPADGVHPRGRPRLEVVRLADIGEAVERTPGFDAKLRPTSERVRRRWESIALAARRGEALPPIELWRTPRGLLVVDGRHRVSVARAQHRGDIDAWVTEVDGGGP